VPAAAGHAASATRRAADAVPYFKQDRNLSCEAASLQMVAAARGIQRTQDQILSALGIDSRGPELGSDGTVVHWGDPYKTFVGDPNGNETKLTGYGTYAPAIARVAAGLGLTVLRSGEGIPAADIYSAVASHHPAVVWVSWRNGLDYSPQTMTSYVAFDGQKVKPVSLHDFKGKKQVALAFFVFAFTGG